MAAVMRNRFSAEYGDSLDTAHAHYGREFTCRLAGAGQNSDKLNRRQTQNGRRLGLGLSLDLELGLVSTVWCRCFGLSLFLTVLRLVDVTGSINTLNVLFLSRTTFCTTEAEQVHRLIQWKYMVESDLT